MHEGKGFSTKTFWASIFQCQNDLSAYGPAGQFWLLESTLRHLAKAHSFDKLSLALLRRWSWAVLCYHFKCTNKFIKYHWRRKIISCSFPCTLFMIAKKVRKKNTRFTDILVFSFALQISLPVMRNRKCVSQRASKVRDREMGQPATMPQQ